MSAESAKEGDSKGASVKEPQPEARQAPPLAVGDDRRVILLPFGLSDHKHVEYALEEVSKLPDDVAKKTIRHTLELFGHRHKDLPKRLEQHCDEALHNVERVPDLDPARRQLVGALLSMEYSIEAAALFNPSIVPHPDQTGLGADELRFVLSLRATGEGHVSSIVFRTGVIGANGEIHLDPPAAYAARAQLTPDQRFRKTLFRQKLADLDLNLNTADAVLEPLGEWFTLQDLEAAASSACARQPGPDGVDQAVSGILWLAQSNYQLTLEEKDTDLSELVIYPRSEGESRGMEDLRLVRFEDDDGTVQYYGTYTAFDGQRILPMLLETQDFRRVAIHTLNGACVQNKGMALFPRRIGGSYTMCGRIDGCNLYLMQSQMVHFWETATLLAQPRYPWELRLIGNCGSPLETSEGWLLFTHGVGPMRRYCIGAMLLDLEDPLRVRGRLREPLLEPGEAHREGYVPNVVYTCGALIHRDTVYLPYAVADTETHMATIKLSDLLQRLLKDGP